MKEDMILGIGAALGVAGLAYALFFTSPPEEKIVQAPEMLLPLGELQALQKHTGSLLPLFDYEFAPSGNEFLDSLLISRETVSTSTVTKNPAAAALGARRGDSTSSSTPKVSPKTALTANTLALRGAAVNIVCMVKDGSVKSVSGSGVIIDSRGIILTVAHVAQMYLLQNYPTPGNVSCVIRTGSPAQNAYTAELIYISPTWIKKYPDTLVAVAPTGTGAHDFALLAITGSATGAPVPSSFPSVPLSNSTPAGGEAVGVGSYGAQYLDNAQKKTGLYQTLVYGVITKPFTFTTEKIEALSVKAGSAAQLGSSGGGMVNTRGEYVGLITNSAISGDFSTRELRAITPLHLRHSFEEDMGQDLDEYLDQSIPVLISSFAVTASLLSNTVIRAIN